MRLQRAAVCDGGVSRLHEGLRIRQNEPSNRLVRVRIAMASRGLSALLAKVPALPVTEEIRVTTIEHVPQPYTIMHEQLNQHERNVEPDEAV